uniref:histidinol dehydrogenase n=1 Tax=Bacteroides acidifaciens TaxID=85831 RepID=UPI0035C11439
RGSRYERDFAIEPEIFHFHKNHLSLFIKILWTDYSTFTLPTNGYAKAYSGVSLDSFIRKITFQEILPEGIKTIGPAIEEMAANEHLDAHKNAVTIRLKAINK